MKTVARVCAIILLSFACSHAETLIVPQGQGWILTLNSNELATIDAYQPSDGPAPFYTQVVKNGATNALYLVGAQQLPAGFAGPLQIVFQTNVAHFINFKKLSAPAFASLTTRFGETNAITVPAGKTLRFYSIIPSIDYEMNMVILVSQGTNTFGGPGIKVIFKPGL